eukprot:7378320-Prymnesium_polylepis.1
MLALLFSASLTDGLCRAPMGLRDATSTVCCPASCGRCSATQDAPLFRGDARSAALRQSASRVSFAHGQRMSPVR